MPAELLLPLFAVVLAVNALFVGLAIRSLWRSGDGGPQPPIRVSAPARTETSVRSGRVPAPGGNDIEAGRSVGADDEVEAVRDVHADEGARAVERGPESAHGLAPTAAAVEPEAAAEPEATAPQAAAQPSAPTRTPRRRAAAAPTAAGSRRRFALPPLDDDHEKVRRSIETFLGGASGPTMAGVPPDPASILTIAVIGLAGPDPSFGPLRTRRMREPGADATAGPTGPAELRAMLERTVRSTARGTDRISVDRQGRVRVILPGTGEVAAHAYLRRIRAIVEPIAEAAAPPTRVVVATATDLDGSVASARRRADRRFAVALQSHQGATIRSGAAEPVDGSDEVLVKPRAAGD